MCTLILAWRAFSAAPVVVAANRDEAADRPSRPPGDWGGDPRIVAPRDALAGGTWIGHNDAGVFAGISNRWMDRELEAERSRGLLVADVLRRRSVPGAADVVEDAVAETAYDGFNLLVADGDRATLLEWDGRLTTTGLAPGVHVLTNAGFDDEFRVPGGRAGPARRQAETARTVRRRLEPEPDESAGEWLDRAAGVLADHEVGACVHGDGYGTRSSSLIALSSDGPPTYRYADGPPCETPFVPVNGQS